MNVYQPVVVKQLKAFYGALLYTADTFPSVHAHLSELATRMHQGLMQQHNAVFAEINNYHPDFLGVPLSDLKQNTWSLADCQFTVAREHGFASWKEVSRQPYHNNFEKAINQLLSGNLLELQLSINNHPELIATKSSYGHGATLLHYCASNGVEMWRQQVPENLPKIVAFLLASGADKEAKMQVYGGNFNTLELLVTSARPAKAGLLQTVAHLLK